jgi:hypothetical protein
VAKTEMEGAGLKMQSECSRNYSKKCVVSIEYILEYYDLFCQNSISNKRREVEVLTFRNKLLL